ncbi:hemerythrin domain-containing protein [Actinospica sp. MGRD01-02]|uniref:Hemerythrin domain-containing protein n=1 Tax=Actinospica acidithermotolerans TaxID=2828514 RepID=A0A941EEM5_9ACTN|nr:hemerythrin domain-containing protein [Actinospica acidithermotolerans]MBR7829283.1 hemerythrin domain-containing protein [Actinospica acidithermotolerans]
MTGHEGNVIAELTTDHREVEGLFEKFKALAPDDHAGRREVADDFTTELVRHSVAEEQYLYPAVREHVPGGGAMADKELADHEKVEQLLKDLERADTTDPRFDTLAAEVIEEVTSHVKDEEERLFPALLEACPMDYLFELGDKIRTAKAAAPTRPHPNAPDNKVATAGAGLVDRVRDLFSGRSRS